MSVVLTLLMMSATTKAAVCREGRVILVCGMWRRRWYGFARGWFA